MSTETLKAAKVRIYPAPEQADFLNRHFGAARFVYNKARHIISSEYKRHGLKLKAKKDIKPLLAVAKKSRKYGWLKDLDSIALQQSCINLNKAFQNFFDPKLAARYPKFKRKHGKPSSYHCRSVSFGSDWIKVPKMKPIKARIHREIAGTLKSITLSPTNTGKYDASLLIEGGLEAPVPVAVFDAVLGIDMGLTPLAIDSEGRKVANPRFLKQGQANLRRKQKSLSRCENGSSGRAKARLTLAKAHERLENTHVDFQHKLSRQLIDENQAVVVETLKVKNMLKDLNLSKPIEDASWSSLIEKLAYKEKQEGQHLVKIDPWFVSSKTCNTCGYKADSMPLSMRKWDCTNCGTKDIDRDVNAALNIRLQGIFQLRAEGLSVFANGGLHKSGLAPVAA